MKENKKRSYLSGQAASPHGVVGKFITKVWTHYFNNLSEWTLRSTPIAKGSTILEVGYGGGSLIKNLVDSDLNVSIYGIDTSNESYQQTLKRNKKAVDAGIVNLQVGDVAKMSYRDAMFDGIFAIQSHIFWEDLELGLKECLRVLKPGGVLVISCEVRMIQLHLNQYYDSFDFNKLLVQMGYSIVKSNKDKTHIIYWCQK